MLMISMAMMAQAQIKFDKTAHDFGKFSEEDPIVKCTFTFTNNDRHRRSCTQDRTR